MAAPPPLPTRPLAAAPIPWARWWAIASAWWLSNGLLFALARASMTAQPVGALLRVDLVSSALWIPVSVFAFWLAQRYPVSRGTWQRTIPLALAAAVGVVLLRAAFVIVTNPFMHWYPVTPPAGQVLVTSVANNLSLFLLVLGAGHGLAYARAFREREELLAQAELAHLKAQLHPHFLFNTLNAVSAYVRSDPDVAVQIIARLSTLLRHALHRAGTQEVPLEEELAIVAAYVEIEQLRFGDRLRVTWNIAPASLSAAVPHLLLQPLVENAIRHGIAPQSAPGLVEIRTERDGDAVRLTVRDDGVGLSAAPPSAHELAPGLEPVTGGVGLANVRRRLVQLYGDAQQFQLTARTPRGVEVCICMPFRQAPRRVATA